MASYSALQSHAAILERGECKVNKQPAKSNEVISEISPEEQRGPAVNQLERGNPNLFEKQACVKNYEIKTKMKDDAKFTHRKGRKSPTRLQNQIDNEIEKLLKEG